MDKSRISTGFEADPEDVERILDENFFDYEWITDDILLVNDDDVDEIVSLLDSADIGCDCELL